MGGCNKGVVAGFVGTWICEGGGVEEIHIRGEEELEGRAWTNKAAVLTLPTSKTNVRLLRLQE